MWVKKIIGFGLLSVILVLGWWSRDVLSLAALADQYASIKTWVSASEQLALILFGLGYCLAVALSLPIAALLTLAGAAVFGWIAVIPIWFGATTGALLVFLAVRFFFSSVAEARLGSRIESVRAAFLAHPFRWALSMRLIPLVPFWVANTLPALLGMPVSQFVASTALGIIPGTLIYVGVGVGFDAILSRGEVPDLATLSSPTIWVPLMALGLFSMLSAVVARRQNGGRDARNDR